MKKLLFICMSLFVIAACSNANDNSNVNNNSHDVGNNDIENADDAQANDHNEAENNNADTENNEATSAVNNDDLKEYEEYDVLKEELDLDVYEGIVESDNKGTRIILFQTADGVKEYKSIFVKKKNRLKIVHFD